MKDLGKIIAKNRKENKMKMVNCLSLRTGTKVRIRKWEDLKKEHIYCGFNSEMAKCCGKIVTVKSFTKATIQDVYGLVKVFFFEGTEKGINKVFTNSPMVNPK